jgi:RNA polymerase sigma factor for flagellar operon FliA
MIDELRSMDWVPRSVRKNEKRLQEAYSKVEKEKMRPARDEEVAEELDVGLEEFHRLLDQVRGVSVLNEEEIGEIAPQGAMDSKWSMNWGIKGTDPFQSVRLNEVKKVIAEAIERLPKNECTVMTLYYYEELTMKEIGNVMGYTESRVSQLHTKSVLRLRNSLRSYFSQ